MDFHRILESVPSSGNGIYNGVGPLTQSISLFFVQATIIIAFSSFLGLAGQYLRSPKVIFEIIAGVILGPSALCRDQWFKEAVFPASSLGNLSIVSNIGLTFYLFIIGIELDTKLLMTHARKTAGIAIAGMAVPFAIGIAISRTMINNLQEGEDTSFVSFFVFIGTAMSITAFPVLARILKEGGMIYTKPGAMTIGAAALNDAIAWCLLALAISLANGGSMNQTGYIFGTMVGIAAFNLFVMKPFMEYLVEYAESNNVTLITSNLFAFTICLLFMNAWFTELIGLDSIFGAFLFGLTIPRGSRLYRNCREWIEEFVLTFTLPLYFTLSGLKTDVTLIQTGEQGAMIVLVCFCATVGKLFGCGVSAYLTGNNIRESATIATLMNTRGLVELIVLNVGLSAGILTTRTFSVMVIMCLFTTFITSPIVSIIYPESMRKNVTSEESAGFEMVKRDSEDDLPIESDNLVKKLAVVIEALPQMQPVIQLLSYFIPRSIGSQFAVTAMHFLEATKTSKDEFLGLNPEGRLIRIDEETTDFFHAYQIMEDPAAKKPELLPVTGFCKANSVPVNAFRIEGDAIEYPAELKSVVMSNDCSLICIPFRANSTFARNLFWTSLNNSPAPVLLLLSVHAHKIGSEKDPQEPRSRSGSLFHGNDSYTKTHLDHDEENPPTLFTNQPRDILPFHRRGSVTNQFQKIECAGLAPHEIVILLTGNHADLVILSLLPRFAENSINKIHVLLPKDHYNFNKKVAEAISASKASFSGSGNVLFLEIPSVSTDYDGLYHDSCKIVYDLFVCSFIAPAAVDMATALSTRTARTNTLLAGGLVDMLIHRPEVDPIDLRLQSGMPMQYAYSNLTNPELGVIGSKIYEGNHTKSSLVLVVHESIKVQARSSIVTENSNVIEMKPANEPTPSDKIDLEV